MAYRLSTIVLVALISWLTSPLLQAEASLSVYGIQSSDIASSYGASMVYDANLHRVYLTGATYGHYFASQQAFSNPPRNVSDCFVAILQLPIMGRNEEPRWLQRTIVSTPGIQDACAALTLTGQGQARHVYTVGHSRDTTESASTYVLSSSAGSINISAVTSNGQASNSYNTTNNDFFVSNDIFSSNSNSNSNNNTDSKNATTKVTNTTTTINSTNRIIDSTLERNTSAKDTESRIYGTIVDLAWDGSPRGGLVQDSERVQYPVSIDTIDKYDIIVGSIYSSVYTEDNYFASWTRVQGGYQPDTTTSGGYLPPQFGTNFSVLLQRLRSTDNDVARFVTKEALSPSPAERNRTYTDNTTLDRNALGDMRTQFMDSQAAKFTRSMPSLRPTLAEVWTIDMKTNEGYSVQLGAVKTLTVQKVIVAGSTKGTGEFFGSQVSSKYINGFVSTVHAQSASLLQSIRVGSQSGNTRILGLCTFGDADVYIVGMTDANLMSGNLTPASIVRSGYYQAFIKRVDVATMQTYWTYQLGGLHPFEFAQVHGIACAVTPDGKHVYMAGTVKDGAVISLDGESASGFNAGQDDVFVLQLETANGTAMYAKQFGTSADDSLGNGDSIASDKDGNLVVVVNTKGSLLRNKSSLTDSDVADVVVMSLNRTTGDHLPIVEFTNMTLRNSTQSSRTPELATVLPQTLPPTTIQPSRSPTSMAQSAKPTSARPNYSSSPSSNPQGPLSPSSLPSSSPSDKAGDKSTSPTYAELPRKSTLEPKSNVTDTGSATSVTATGKRNRSYVIAAVFTANILFAGCITVVLSRRQRAAKSQELSEYAGLYKNSYRGHCDEVYRDGVVIVDDDEDDYSGGGRVVGGGGGNVGLFRTANRGLKCTYRHGDLVDDRLQQEGRMDEHERLFRRRSNRHSHRYEEYDDDGSHQQQQRQRAIDDHSPPLTRRRTSVSVDEWDHSTYMDESVAPHATAASPMSYESLEGGRLARGHHRESSLQSGHDRLLQSTFHAHRSAQYSQGRSFREDTINHDRERLSTYNIVERATQYIQDHHYLEEFSCINEVDEEDLTSISPSSQSDLASSLNDDATALDSLFEESLSRRMRSRMIT
jgi:hypothetical protein